MNKLKYKGYIGTVDYSKEDQVFFGKIERINGLINFEGVHEKELKIAFEKAVDDYLAYCQTNSVFPYVIPMLRVVDVDYIKDYELLATFSNGSKKNIDLKPYLTGEVFGELLDKDIFTQYSLTNVTIEWANGADLAPEFLYEIGTELEIKANTLFIGQVIEQARKKAAITQTELAKKIGTDKVYISQIEAGEIDPTVSTFYRIASALGLNVELMPNPIVKIESEIEYKAMCQRIEELLPMTGNDTPVTDCRFIELKLTSDLAADYDEEHYNNRRLHQSLGYKTPEKIYW